jgi:hypothetical protein
MAPTKTLVMQKVQDPEPWATFITLEIHGNTLCLVSVELVPAAPEQSFVNLCAMGKYIEHIHTFSCW